jgi:DNA invertase Pin-like site-specific DNA recombinase
MIAAIYSTDQNGIGDEERTVTRQIEHAKAYAAQKGWMVSEDYVYVDDGISGAGCEAPSFPPCHERAQAEAVVPGSHHV